MIAEDFGKWLKRQLHRREWSQARLAREAGVSPTAVSHWITGKKLPDAESCDKIAEAFFLSRDEVLSRAGLRPVEHDDSETVRELIALVRRIHWTPDRVNSARGMLQGMASFSLDEGAPR